MRWWNIISGNAVSYPILLPCLFIFAFQPLGRLGATVTGLDAGKENITMAQMNLPPDLHQNVQFVCSTVEEFVSTNPDSQFDGVVASEVIEHVQDPKLFLQIASQCVKVCSAIFN
jgi:2-polyprenyl-3-methyl-5-hydroxy-6-metoxy-1,4-benzoquinol methylase